METPPVGQLNGIEGHVVCIFGHTQQPWGGSSAPVLGALQQGQLWMVWRATRSVSYLHHGFVYLPFFKQKEVVGTVVVLVNPKASCLANTRIVCVHRHREARFRGRMRWWHVGTWNNTKHDHETYGVAKTMGGWGLFSQEHIFPHSLYYSLFLSVQLLSLHLHLSFQ